MSLEFFLACCFVIYVRVCCGAVKELNPADCMNFQACLEFCRTLEIVFEPGLVSNRIEQEQSMSSFNFYDYFIIFYFNRAELYSSFIAF